MERSTTSSDAPDIFRWTLVGNVNVQDVERLFAEQLVFSQGKSSIYVVVDMTRLGSVTADARRAAARGPTGNGSSMLVRAVAVVGGSFHLRMLGKMVNTAAALLYRTNPTPIDFFDTNKQARDWIESLKRVADRKEAGARPGL